MVTSAGVLKGVPDRWHKYRVVEAGHLLGTSEPEDPDRAERPSRAGAREAAFTDRRPASSVRRATLFVPALPAQNGDDPQLFGLNAAQMNLAAALEEAELPGGQAALLAALRHISEAQGMSAVAARAGIPRESLYRALSPKGNPTIKTFLAVVRGAGLHLEVSREPAHA